MNGGRLVVAHFSNARAWGGAEEHMARLLAHLPRERIQPLLAAPAALLASGAGRWPAEVEALAVDLQSPLPGRAAVRLARWLRRRRVDVLHAHMFRASACAAWVAALAGVGRIIETPHVREAWREPPAGEGRGWRHWKRSYLWDRLHSRLIDRYIAVSQANAAYLIEQKGLPAAKVAVIPNGCDLNFWRPRPRRACWPEAWGWSQHDPLLVQIGRLEPQKGHGVLLDALPRLWERFPNLHVVLLGEGSLRRDLESRIAGMERRGVVRLAGYSPDPRDWLAAAWITVLPSWYEGLPLAALESLAMSRPVVGSDVDGMPEVVRHGTNGLLTPAGKAGALGEAIAELLSNRELREGMGAAGRAWVEQHFSLEQQVEATAEIYQAAAGAGHQRAAPCTWGARS